MKRLLFIAAIAASVVSTASAKVPETLRRQSTDTDAIAFFNAMDDFETANPDGISVVTYDSYPDGTKVIMRRIDYSRNDDEPQERICAVFDSITAKPDPNRIAMRNISGKMSLVRVYKMKESPNDNTIDLSSNSGSVEAGTAACINIVNGVTIAQNWTIHTDHPQGAPNLKKLNDAINALAKEKDTVRRFDYSDAPRPNRGGLRMRDPEPITNHLEYDRIFLPDASVQQWIDLRHTFMESLGADGDISLTYYRQYRMVTLVDMATKTVYAAEFHSNAPEGGKPGMLTILVGHYVEEPFLPVDWATLRKPNI